jgi:hypothetical protein
MWLLYTITIYYIQITFIGFYKNKVFYSCFSIKNVKWSIWKNEYSLEIPESTKHRQRKCSTDRLDNIIIWNIHKAPKTWEKYLPINQYCNIQSTKQLLVNKKLIIHCFTKIQFKDIRYRIFFIIQKKWRQHPSSGEQFKKLQQ